jgi:T5SS/PEP-CTERM-associated repeat protein
MLRQQDNHTLAATYTDIAGMDISSNTPIDLGASSGSTDSKGVEGPGSTLNDSGTAVIGGNGTGDLAVTDAGTVNTGNVVIGQDPGSTGMVDVTGPGSSTPLPATLNAANLNAFLITLLDPNVEQLTAPFEIWFSEATTQRFNIENRFDDIIAGSTGFVSNVSYPTPAPTGKEVTEGKGVVVGKEIKEAPTAAIGIVRNDRVCDVMRAVSRNLKKQCDEIKEVYPAGDSYNHLLRWWPGPG